MKNIVNKSNKFWKEYSKLNRSENSLMNLESNEEKSLEKFILEKKHLEKVVSFKDNNVIVDIGAGVGLWAEYFSPKVKKVYLVEKQENFINIAKKRIYNLDIFNIETVLSDVVNFDLDEESVDYVFISGVTIYLSDNVLDKVLKKIFKYLKPKGKIIHRDAYARNELYIVNNYSDALNMDYVAIYRTRKEYDNYFINKNNFKNIYDKDMYSGGKNSPYNKWNKTRLRLAIYQK